MQEAFSFIHTADLHFDSSFQGLTNEIDPNLLKKIQDASYHSFHNIVQACLEKKVDFLLIAGDIYNSENKSISAQLRLFKEIKTLSDAGIATFIVYGNHDPFGSWSATITPPEHCSIFTDTIETKCYSRNGQKIAEIIGYSHPNRHVKENIVLKFPEVSDEVFHIGLIHCSVDTPGVAENYAPCKKKDLLQKNYQYWALGHIHAPSILHQASSIVIYPGSHQGRNFGEIGEHGCYYVSVDEKGDIHPEWVATDTIRFIEGEITITDLSSLDEITKSLIKDIKHKLKESGGRSLVLRYTITGQGMLHSDLMREDSIRAITREVNDFFSDSESFGVICGLSLLTMETIERGRLRNQPFYSELLQISEAVIKNPLDYATITDPVNSVYKDSKLAGYCSKDTAPPIEIIIERAEHLLLDKLRREVPQ